MTAIPDLVINQFHPTALIGQVGLIGKIKEENILQWVVRDAKLVEEKLQFDIDIILKDYSWIRIIGNTTEFYIIDFNKNAKINELLFEHLNEWFNTQLRKYYGY